MATKNPNLKVNVTADNSDLNKKMKDAKASVKDFSKVSEEALGKFGEFFGVNVGKIEQMGSALRGLGNRLQETGNAGSAAFGKLLTGVNGLVAGLAGIGIAGVVAGFKMLQEEAETFKNTLEGASIDKMTTAYIDTYKQVLNDFNIETARSVAEAEQSWKIAWAEFSANLRYVITSGSIGAGTSVLGGLRKIFTAGDPEARAAATEAATEASRLTERMYNIQVQMANKTVEWARMEREIAEYKRIAYDKTVDTVTQQEALNKATELIEQRYKDEAKYKKQLADLQEQYNSLASSSLEDIQRANQLRIDEENTIARMNNALRELSEREASILAERQKETAELEKQAALVAQMNASRAALADWRAKATISEGNTLKDSLPATVEAPDGGIAIPITPTLDTEAVADISQELQLTLVSAFDGIGVAVGELIGDLATGGDAWGNFANTAISAFGDMAISVGRMAIQTGVATLGIKAALKSLNGYVAIAAGTALVALGAAVKAGLSNIASGSYSSSSNVANAGGYGQGSSLGADFETREMKVEVTGTLRASGNELMTVIENENNRKKHTT